MGSGRKEEEEEDRISRFPDDLIHHILSKMDAKDVIIQTCLLSTRWRHVWRSLQHLNFDGRHFSNFLKFTKFVSQFLSNRSRHLDISVLNFNSDHRTIDHSFIRKIALYTRNAHKVNITSYVSLKGNRQLPLSVFNSGSLKELCLNTRSLVVTNMDGYSWNLGALTTLVFEGVSIVSCPKDGRGKSIDHFSNLLNLRHLTLTDCVTLNSNALSIITPQLESLTITISVRVAHSELIVSAPNLSSFSYTVCYPWSSCSIFSDDFPCIERVNINVPGFHYMSNEQAIQELIGLLHKLRNAMSLTLTMDTVFLLSSVPSLLENQASPFRNLKWLKIKKQKQWWGKSTKYCHAVISYLCYHQ